VYSRSRTTLEVVDEMPDNFTLKRAEYSTQAATGASSRIAGCTLQLARNAENQEFSP
jgi:hypothetical protein